MITSIHTLINSDGNRILKFTIKDNDECEILHLRAKGNFICGTTDPANKAHIRNAVDARAIYAKRLSEGAKVCHIKGSRLLSVG